MGGERGGLGKELRAEQSSGRAAHAVSAPAEELREAAARVKCGRVGGRRRRALPCDSRHVWRPPGRARRAAPPLPVLSPSSPRPHHMSLTWRQSRRRLATCRGGQQEPPPGRTGSDTAAHGGPDGAHRAPGRLRCCPAGPGGTVVERGVPTEHPPPPHSSHLPRGFGIFHPPPFLWRHPKRRRGDGDAQPPRGARLEGVGGGGSGGFPQRGGGVPLRGGSPLLHSIPRLLGASCCKSAERGCGGVYLPKQTSPPEGLRSFFPAERRASGGKLIR